MSSLETALQAVTLTSSSEHAEDPVPFAMGESASRSETRDLPHGDGGEDVYCTRGLDSGNDLSQLHITR